MEVEDNHSELSVLCRTLEAILRKGLIYSQPSPFGLTKKDYWSWIQMTLSSDKYEIVFKMSLERILESQRVTTPQGRGRLFIRHSLMSKCFHIPIEEMVRRRCFHKVYQAESSVVGNEILGEIFLSLTYQLSQLMFSLKLENAAFLDDSWNLPDYYQYELSPCLDLGLYLGHVKGWAVVLNVDEGSVAAEDKKIERGDIIDELFGVCIKGWKKSKISSLFKEKKGLPILLKVIKCRLKNGRIYEGMVPILQRLQLDVDCLQELPSTEETSLSSLPINGHFVDYLGSVDVGSCGDVAHIEDAVTEALLTNHDPVQVVMVTGEIGVQTLVRATGNILLNHSYTEISSCGRRNDAPLIFAYISGDTSCSLASQFMCHIFRSTTDGLSREILLTIGMCPGKIELAIQVHSHFGEQNG